MSIVMFMLALFFGFVCGRVSVKDDQRPKDYEPTKADLDTMRTDIVYYKKLTHDLVEENKELRTKNGNQKTSSKNYSTKK
jgi:hypothetical protein